jgi:sec-independent protein translocase protein TatB
MLHGGDGFELLLIAAVALIVVGPKDLPILLRKLGQFVGKMRGMAAEFRASFDEMARQSELDELRKEVEAMRQGQFADQAARATGTEGVSQIFQEIGDSLGEVQLHPPMSHQYDAAAMVASSEPMTVETVLPARAKARATKASASKPTPARSAKAAPARPARSPAATPMTVKAPSRVKAARVAVPAKAKPIAKPKAPVKPTSAKAVAAKVPRAPVQRAKPVAATKARSRK